MPSLDIIIPAYNAGHSLDDTLEAVMRQSVPDTLRLGVIVVNNGSTDATADRIDAWSARGVRRVDHTAIRSRAAARNAGVAASRADYLLLLDADCRLVGNQCLGVIAAAIDAHVAAGFGYATGETNSFWGRYHHALEQDRGKADWLGWTTQCCLVKHEVFDTVGGFCENYRHYGFEDRDFFCMLRSSNEIGELRALPDVRVLHDPDTTIATVCEKMYTSGRHSSGIFRKNFPLEYAEMPYAKVDVATAPRHLALILRLLQPFQPVFIRITDSLTRRRRTSLAIGRLLVRMCSALSYFAGTRERIAAP